MVSVHKIAFCNFQSPVIFTSHLATDISSGLKKLLYHLNTSIPFHGLRPIPKFPPPLPTVLGARGSMKIKGVDRGVDSG